jgi:hypothetical protein
VNHLLAAALDVQKFLRNRQRRFCFVGGLAMLRWEEPRMGICVELLVLTSVAEDEHFVEELGAQFRPRIADAIPFALRSRVLLVQASNGVPVDVALGGFPFEEMAVRRATPFEFAPGVSLVTCSAEDLIVFKAFAAREQDWVDVAGVAVRQGVGLDWPYVEEQLRFLCELKEEPEILDRLRSVREKASR